MGRYLAVRLSLSFHRVVERVGAGTRPRRPSIRSGPALHTTSRAIGSGFFVSRFWRSSMSSKGIRALVHASWRRLVNGPPRCRGVSRPRSVWSRVVVLTLTALLVLTLGQAVGSTQDVDQVSPRDLPLLLSPEQRQLPGFGEGFAPEAGMTGPNGVAGFDPRTSTETTRSEHSMQYANADGTNSVVLSQTPVGVADGTGGWAPVDTRLVEEPGTARVATTQTQAEVSFAESAAVADSVRIEHSGAGLTMALEGADESRREVADSTVTYRDVLPGVDLTYEVTADSVKESLILAAPDAIADGRWEFRLGATGLTPRIRGDTVEFTDPADTVTAALPPIQVWDAAGAATGGVYELERRDDSWRLTVSVNRGWLTDAARVYPVVIDPTYTFAAGQQAETIAYPQTGQACALSFCGIRTGNARIFTTNAFWRTAVRYNLAPLAGKTITGAQLNLQLTTGASSQMTPVSQVTLHRATAPLGFAAMGAQLAAADLGTSGSLSSAALTAYLGEGAAATDNNLWFMLGGTETNTYSYKTLQASLVVDYVDTTTPPPGPQVNRVAPVEDAIVGTDTPSLEVNAAAAGTKYCFKISTGFDGRSGTVVDSGCLTTPKWVVPAHVLRDGGRYSWTVATVPAGGSTPTPQNWVGHFTVDRRIGKPGPAPTDDLGPVTVNLYNGNLHTEAAGPVFEALGGSAGVTFAYNSRQSGDGHGVRATYFQDADHNGVADEPPVMVRSEQQVNLDWGNVWSNVSENLPWKEDPMPAALDDQWFVVRWEGYFRAPVTGDFSFAGAHTDGAKIRVGNTLAYDNPVAAAGVAANFSQPAAAQSTDVSLVAGQRVPITVELTHSTVDRPRMVLWAKSTTGAAGSRSHNLTPRIVPTDWLFAQDPAPLPGGWTLGVMGSAYVSAEMLDGSVILTDAAGGKHTWSKTAGGGYTPPRSSDGVLAVAADGAVSVTENGVVSVFHVDGTLAEVASVTDSKKPSSLRYLYSGSPARLTGILDPVSGRSHVLHYNTDNSDNCYGGATFPTGAHSAPDQKLCRITYWDGSQTRLWYTVGALTRIENPGAEIRDFSYLNLEAAKLEYNQAGTDTARKLRAIDSVGPLNELRDSLGADWRATQTSFSGNTDRTLIEYDSFVDDLTSGRPPHARVIRVTAPAANGISIAGRAAHIYRYDILAKKAYVGVEGIQVLNVHTVAWDAAGRQLSRIDAVGNTTSTEWDAKDKRTAGIDSAGRRETLVYDHADRPTDVYGPAPAACFAGQSPTTACASSLPHSQVAYDEGVVGLAAAFYDNPDLAGVPDEWRTGVGTSDGTLTANWGATPPVANTAGWSGRFTGEIRFPTAGEYTLALAVVDGARLWIDDMLVIDSWTDKAATTVTGVHTEVTPGSWRRVRVDYYNRAGTTGTLDFDWTQPGTTTPATVAGEHLRPRYGNQTSQTSHSGSGGPVERAPSTTVATGYSDPANDIDPVFGTAVSKTSDPGGAALTVRQLLEQPGQGYLRPLAAAQPSGDLTDPDQRVTFIYYESTETRSNPCDSASQPVNQGGRVKAIRGAENADGSSSVMERVYDATGRIAAVRTGAEPWLCERYDARGRILEKAFPAIGAQPGRTVTYEYAVAGNPLRKRVTDSSGSTATTFDLLGRIAGYTDANGNVTAIGYDTAGRKIREQTTVGGLTSTLDYQMDSASRLTRLDLDGTPVATPAYTAGLLTSVTYRNGSSLAVGRNDAGTIGSLAWNVADSTVVSAVTRARDQRILGEIVTDSLGGGTDYHYSYTYDTAGRLVGADVPHHELTYSFAGDGGCGPNTRAGRNSNRTTTTDTVSGGTSVTTTYCYDHADRLLSAAGGTNLSLTYDAYGNAITVGTDSLGYDSTRRHVSTATAAGRTVTYTRDVTERITVRTANDPGQPAQVTRYGFTADTGGPDFVLDSSGALRQRVLKLPGGAVLTKSYTQTTENWSYPNVNGHILFTADAAAARTGAIRLYDPYGQNIDPVSGTFADLPLPATAEGGMDFGWLGQHTVPIEHIGSYQALEMGTRTYLPVLGRFLQTDPILGGSANDYDYVNADPINNTDLTGAAPDRSGRDKPELDPRVYDPLNGGLRNPQTPDTDPDGPFAAPDIDPEVAKLDPIEGMAADLPATPSRDTWHAQLRSGERGISSDEVIRNAERVLYDEKGQQIYVWDQGNGTSNVAIRDPSTGNIPSVQNSNNDWIERQIDNGRWYELN
ncbi:PA14 domain-containing protein [Nocardia takedensis]